MSAQYFAKLDENNVVVDVHVVTKEFLESNPQRYTGRWVETFYDVPGKTYAGISWIYDEEAEDFTPPPLPPIEP